MTTATINHIEIDDRGVAKIAGSRIKVKHLVEARMVNGWGPEELHEQFPHLSLAKIYAAFAYYYDHKDAIDAEIEADERFAEEARLAAGESALAKRLRAEGRLP
jgi:uncharacterized protein (DUF433 family)